MNVLLLDGHTIQALPMMKALCKKHISVTIFCEQRISYGYFSRYANSKIICPSPKHNEIDYLYFLKNFLQKHPQDYVIPLFNDSAEFVSKYKEQIEACGCKVEIPTWSTFIKAHDKEQLMQICKLLAIPHPRTANPEKIGYQKAIEYVKYPCLIKPNLGAGAKGIKLLRNKTDFDKYYAQTLKEFGPSCIQEFIPQNGKQYKVQLYRDEHYGIIASSIYEKCRYYPLDGGTSTCNRTITRPDLVELYAKILEHINWIGIADFDCIEDPRDNSVKLMEINPRVPGTIKASFISGIDFAEIMTDHLCGNTYKTYTYRPDKILRNLATELLWFYESKERFNTTPNWFHFIGKDIYYADGSWKDPFPMIAGFINGIKKLSNANFRKSKNKNK